MREHPDEEADQCPYLWWKNSTHLLLLSHSCHTTRQCERSNNHDHTVLKQLISMREDLYIPDQDIIAPTKTAALMTRQQLAEELRNIQSLYMYMYVQSIVLQEYHIRMTACIETFDSAECFHNLNPNFILAGVFVTYQLCAAAETLPSS